MTGPKMEVGEPGAFERMNARDREWMDALSAEFKIGGAMYESDRKWVMEKASIPERWARLVRLAIAPKDERGRLLEKLHSYEEAPPVDVLVLRKPKRDVSEVMKQLRPLLVQGAVDMGEFNDLESSVAFAPPESEKLHWERLCEMLEETLPEPNANAPQWVRDVADIITGRK